MRYRFSILAGILLIALLPIASAQEERDPQEVPIFLAGYGEQDSTINIIRLIPSDQSIERITDDELDDLNPLPSYDGRYVVFLRGDVRDPNSTLAWHLLDTACLPDCEPVALPDEANQLGDLRWSPNSYQLVGWGAEEELWIINVEDNTVKQVTDDSEWDSFPAWSPDGSMIVFTSDRLAADQTMLSDDIHVIPASGGDSTNLTYSGLFIEDGPSRWSPDGRWIAYIAENVMGETDDEFGDYYLLVIDATCVEADDPAAACLASRKALSLEGQPVLSFEWSPDSQFIAYLEGSAVAGPNGNVWIVGLEDGTPQQITGEMADSNLTWSPDSTAILFERSTEEILQVYIAVPASGQEPQVLLEGFVFTLDPSWTPQH